MKKGKLKYIIIIVVLVIYGVGMYLVFGISETKERKASTTILVGDFAVWNYSSRDWMNVSSQNLLSELNWQKFNIYVDNQYFGKYLIWQDDKLYLFDDDRKPVNYDGNLFAYKAGFDMNVLPFTVSDVTDYSYVKEVLLNHNLSPDSQFTLAQVASLDFDQDGVNEDFYTVSNAFADDFFPDKYFSFAFMVKDNRIYMLYEDVDTNDGVNGCKPSLYTIADFDNDNQYELILVCYKYSNQTPLAMLYEFGDQGFKIEISNQ